MGQRTVFLKCVNGSQEYICLFTREKIHIKYMAQTDSSTEIETL